MNSWRLFTSGIVFWDTDENPIFLREADHEPAWYKAAKRVKRIPPLAVVSGPFFVWFILILIFENALVFLLLPRFLLVAATSLTLAPIVVGERVKSSWETLLVAPFSPLEVLLSKTGGALWWLRHAFLAISALLFLVALGVGFISLALTPTRLPWVDEVPVYVLCLGVIVLPIVWSVAFVIDRTQQFLLVISASVAVSSSAPSLRTAFFSALPASLIAWSLEVMLAGTLLTLRSGRTPIVGETNVLSLITLGPVVNFIVQFDLLETIVWTCLTFLGREIAIRCLWRWAEHRARSF